MSEVGTSKMISLSMAGEDFQKIALPNLKSNEPPPSKLGGIRGHKLKSFNCSTCSLGFPCLAT